MTPLVASCGMIWTPYVWLNKGYSFYKVAVLVIGDGRGLRIKERCRNQPNKSNIVYVVIFPLTLLLNGCTQATRRSASVIWVW